MAPPSAHATHVCSVDVMQFLGRYLVHSRPNPRSQHCRVTRGTNYGAIARQPLRQHETIGNDTPRDQAYRLPSPIIAPME
jgi:hypothetical protein